MSRRNKMVKFKDYINEEKRETTVKAEKVNDICKKYHINVGQIKFNKSKDNIYYTIRIGIDGVEVNLSNSSLHKNYLNISTVSKSFDELEFDSFTKNAVSLNKAIQEIKNIL